MQISISSSIKVTYKIKCKKYTIIHQKQTASKLLHKYIKERLTYIKLNVMTITL